MEVRISKKNTYTTDDARQLSIGQRKCIFSDEIKLNYFPDAYTFSSCMKQCRMNKAIKLCKCNPPFYKPIGARPRSAILNMMISINVACFQSMSPCAWSRTLIASMSSRRTSPTSRTVCSASSAVPRPYSTSISSLKCGFSYQIDSRLPTRTSFLFIFQCGQTREHRCSRRVPYLAHYPLQARGSLRLGGSSSVLWRHCQSVSGILSAVRGGDYLLLHTPRLLYGL